MDVQTERSSTASLLNHGQNRAPTSSSLTTPASLPNAAEDKDSIYTFSDNCMSDNDETDLIDHDKVVSKYSSRLGSSITTTDTKSSVTMVATPVSATTTDKNLNDTRYLTLKESVRTYGKKRPTTTASIDKKKSSSASKSTPSSIDKNKPSCSPLQSQKSTIAPLSSPLHESKSSVISQSNGSMLASGKTPPTPSLTSSPLKKVLSGKPKAFALAAETNKKSSQTTSSTSVATKLSRGRPKRKALVAMYQSQLSENKMGIKIRLKKSLQAPISKTLTSAGHTTKKKSTSVTAATTTATVTASASKPTRKRQRKSRHKDTSDSDDSEYEKRRRNNNTSTEKHRNRKTTTANYTEPEEQSGWGSTLPEEILLKIFEDAVNIYGCLPTIVNVGKVCSLWRRVSLSPQLWHTLDLSSWTKDRSELNLKWIIDNHLHGCKDVNLANWKVTNIDCVLDHLHEACPDLVAISLAGWKEFTGDHLAYLVEEFKSLQKIDLSSVNLELNPNKSAVGTQSLCSAIQTFGSRLTHLYLAHNRLAGIPQIVTALSAHCPNLSLLDLSNVSTVAASHGMLHIEKLQEGCSRLKVLRITNSQITLSAATLQEQMDSPGFPELEELSVASLADESRLMNDEFLQRILKTSTKLKLLDVRGCARLTHDTLIRLPTWDVKHLFLSGCSVTRDIGSGLELIASKWAHSLTEFDLAWANVQEPLDNAIKAIAEKGAESPLNHLNLCGSSVSLEAVKQILINCRYLNSINLSSCRGLPRGVKRLLQGSTEIRELRENLGVKLKYSPPEDEEKIIAVDDNTVSTKEAIAVVPAGQQQSLIVADIADKS